MRFEMEKIYIDAVYALQGLDAELGGRRALPRADLPRGGA